MDGRNLNCFAAVPLVLFKRKWQPLERRVISTLAIQLQRHCQGYVCLAQIFTFPGICDTEQHLQPRKCVTQRLHLIYTVPANSLQANYQTCCVVQRRQCSPAYQNWENGKELSSIAWHFDILQYVPWYANDRWSSNDVSDLC